MDLYKVLGEDLMPYLDDGLSNSQVPSKHILSQIPANFPSAVRVEYHSTLTIQCLQLKLVTIYINKLQK